MRGRALPPHWPLLMSAALTCMPVSADTVNARFPRQARDQANVFTRMFADLPPFAAQSDSVRNAARLFGVKGGPLDANDDLSDPIQSILNQPVFSPDNPDNPSMTAGITFLGQFLDHHITLDLRSRLLANSEPGRTVNFRSAAFDLDSVYGEGPERSPELYDTSSGDIRFIVQPIPGSEAVSRKGAVRYDVPRDTNGDAIVGDSRNDENAVISQFHLAMLRFHNAVVGQAPRQCRRRAQACATRLLHAHPRRGVRRPGAAALRRTATSAQHRSLEATRRRAGLPSHSNDHRRRLTLNAAGSVSCEETKWLLLGIHPACIHRPRDADLADAHSGRGIATHAHAVAEVRRCAGAALSPEALPTGRRSGTTPRVTQNVSSFARGA